MQVENITKEYVVPIGSGVHMEYPQRNRERKMIYKQPIYDIAEPNTLNQDRVIEQMSGVDGITTASQNAQVIALENQIATKKNRENTIMAELSHATTEIGKITKERDDMVADLQSCVWRGGVRQNYECNSGVHAKGWKDTRESYINEYSRRISQYNSSIESYNKELSQIKIDIPILETNLAKAREEAAVAAMTPEQKTQYEVNKTQAQAEAEATRIKAEAEAASTRSKSKVFLIVGIAAGVALLGGLTFYLIKGRKKAPITAPILK